MAEVITSSKEFCDCEFRWLIDGGASGKSIGETLPAYPEDVTNEYPIEDFTVHNAAVIPCRQVLGSYVVKFER